MQLLYAWSQTYPSISITHCSQKLPNFVKRLLVVHLKMELKHFEFSPVMDQASIYYTCLIPFISESPLRISINLEHFYLLIYYTDHSSGRHCFLPSVAIYSYAILFLDLLIICLLRCELSNFFYFIFQLDSNLDRQYLYYSVNHWLKNHKKLSS